MSQKGWISLHRKIQDCWIWSEDEPFDRRSAWIDLLLLANHEDKKIGFDGHPVIIKRGQYLTSILKLSDRWGWSRNKTKRFLAVLEEEQMITTDRTNKRTIINVVNYGVYNDVGQKREPTDEPTEGQQKDNRRTTDEPQTTIINNVNNENNENKNNKAKPVRHKYGEYKNVLLSDAELEKLKDEFPDWSRRIENLSEYMASSGKSYKNHLATIRTWARKEKPKKTNDKFQSIADWASKEWQ